MTDRRITHYRIVGGDYFRLGYINNARDLKSPTIKYLKDYLPLFNFEEYWCFKTTGQQRLMDYEDLLEFKYAGYTFMKKDIYKIHNIEIWLGWMKTATGGIQYLQKPTPPFNPKKIIIKQ